MATSNTNADLDQRIQRIRGLIEAHGDDANDEQGLQVLARQYSDLCGMLFSRFNLSGDSTNLQEALDYACVAQALTHSDDPLHQTAVLQQCDILNARGTLQDGVVEEITEAIRLCDGLLQRELNSEIRNRALQALGNAYVRTKFLSRGDAAYRSALNGALDAYKKVVAHGLPLSSGTTAPAVWFNLGCVCTQMFETTRTTNDLDYAITTYREGTAHIPDSSPLRKPHVHTFGNLLQVRFDKFHASADIDEAIGLARNLRQLNSAPSDPSRASDLDVLCKRLLGKYLNAPNPACLREAIDAGEEVVRGTPNGSSQRAERLERLGTAYLLLYKMTDDLDDLDKCISLLEEAGSCIQPGYDPSRIWNNVGHACDLRQRRTGDVMSLNRAIEATDLAINQATPGTRDAGILIGDVGRLLVERYERCSDRSDLIRARDLYHETLKIFGDRDPLRPASLFNIGRTFLLESDETASREALAGSIRWYNASVAATPSHLQQDKAGRLCGLGEAQQKLYLQTKRPEDASIALKSLQDSVSLLRTQAKNSEQQKALARSLVALSRCTGDTFPPSSAALDEAVLHAREAAQVAEDRTAEHALALSNLGLQLRARFNAGGGQEDVSDCIQAFRDAVGVVPRESIVWAGYSINLGEALRDKFRSVSHEMADLDESILVAKEAEAALHEKPLIRAKALGAYSEGLRLRFETKGDMEDLKAAGDASQLAVSKIPSGHPERARRQANLAEILSLRRTRSDFERAASNIEMALSSEGLDVTQKTTLLHTKAVIHAYWFDFSGTPDVLDTALAAAKDALRLGGETISNYALNSLTVSNILSARFLSRGDTKDIYESIRIGEQALAACPAGMPVLRRSILTSLGNKYGWRYEYLSAEEDVHQAIALCRESLTLVQAPDNDQPLCLNNLAEKLVLLFRRHQNLIGVLEEAVMLGEASLDLKWRNHPKRPGWLTNQSVRLDLLSQFGSSDEKSNDHLSRAVLLAREAVSEARDPYVRAGALNNLSNRLQAMNSHKQDANTLNEAVRMSEECITCTPILHPSRARRLRQYAAALIKRDKPDDRELAKKLLTDALRHTASPPVDRLRAANRLSSLLDTERDQISLYDVLKEAIDLFPKLSLRSLPRDDQQQRIAEFSKLATIASAAALQAGCHPAEALDLLEKGRGNVIALAMDMRTDLEELRQHSSQAKELCERFERARAQLNGIGARDAGLLTNSGLSTEDERSSNLQTCARDMDDTVDEIRRLPGFSRFLLPPDSEASKALGRDGPIIVVNITRIRSDALVVLEDTIQSIPLPNATPSELEDQTAILDKNRRAKGSKYRPGCVALQGVFLWLWKNVAFPILASLGLTQPKESTKSLTRVWWICCGTMTLMPLQAAGTGRPSENVFDHVLSTFTPTMRALEHCRKVNGAIVDSPTPQVIVVAMPVTEPRARYNDLNTAREVRFIKDAFESSAFVIVDLPTPTKANTTKALRIAAIAHFACHGESDTSNPSNSKLLLDDHITDPLTVKVITQSYAPTARLAYLSACHSARSTTAELADEVIHIASAFQLGGFPSVIGTSWEAWDDTAVRVSGSFYKSLLRNWQTRPIDDTFAVALALHDAVVEERRRDPVQTIKWASFIHFGA